VNSTKHDIIADNSGDLIIKEMLIKKCSWYYEFKNVLEDISIIISSCVIEFIRSLEDLNLEEKEEEEKETDVRTLTFNRHLT
jgi:hypothetical protein